MGMFSKKTRIDAPVEAVFQWHARPGAIQRLSPPWDPIKVLSQKGGIQTNAEVVMRMKFGPFSFKWIARHTDYIQNRLFQDQQIQGPFSKWIHTHTFSPDGSNACILEDAIEYSLPFHPVGSPITEKWIHRKLERIFTYRHHTTRMDMARHESAAGKAPMNILISGASGMIGSALTPFLTTGGHRVFRLVRRPPAAPDEIYWNPEAGIVQLDRRQVFHAVIHLAGENIGQGRWNQSKKKKIVASRIQGTSTLVRAVMNLKTLPKIFLNASAIGYYGHRGDLILTEKDPPGADFVSEVCTQWETAAMPLMHKNIRLVLMRIGIVISPTAGALARLLMPFRLGLGGKIGSGDQYMSWISIDDVIYAIHHLLFNESIHGPVNLVSPNPVTNKNFTKFLAKTLSRPAIFAIPRRFIELFFGQMGRETILSSTRALPMQLINSGYDFSYPDLESALRHVLGNPLGKDI